jgi:two-component system, response regulator
MTSVDKIILLVEDNPDDAKLTLRAFKKCNIANPIVVTEDGVEALDFLFARGKYGNRAGKPAPMLVVLDLKLPRLDGHGVLKAMRADPRTKVIPVVVMTSSKEERDVIESYTLGANSYVRKPVDFTEFVEAAKLLGMYWLMLNEPLPRRPGADSE